MHASDRLLEYSKTSTATTSYNMITNPHGQEKTKKVAFDSCKCDENFLKSLVMVATLPNNERKASLHSHHVCTVRLVGLCAHRTHDSTGQMRTISAQTTAAYVRAIASWMFSHLAHPEEHHTRRVPKQFLQYVLEHLGHAQKALRTMKNTIIPFKLDESIWDKPYEVTPGMENFANRSLAISKLKLERRRSLSAADGIYNSSFANLCEKKHFTASILKAREAFFFSDRAEMRKFTTFRCAKAHIMPCQTQGYLRIEDFIDCIEKLKRSPSPDSSTWVIVVLVILAALVLLSSSVAWSMSSQHRGSSGMHMRVRLFVRQFISDSGEERPTNLAT
uniref:Uncharacterized protein n=1 Tax=Parascaris equorum TaxID=6256 RepID=A0A914RRX9_PAREQ